MAYEVADPIGDALRAYGADPKYTPRNATIEWSAEGITVDQMVLDEAGYPMMNEAPNGLLTPKGVLVRKFFRHPKPSPEWTTVIVDPAIKYDTDITSTVSIPADLMSADEAIREFGNV